MSFIIDTNLLIEIEKDNKSILNKMEKLGIKGDICITSPTYTEFYFGLLRSSMDKLKLEKERLDKYKLLNTTRESSIFLAEIKNKLSSKGVMVPIFDLFIASIAIESRLPLVTMDKHFNKIPNLNIILLE